MGLLSLAESRLCALFFESILYGLYIITFCCTAEVLLFSHHKLKPINEVNIPVFAGTTSLFFTITGGLALSFYRSLRAFIFSSLPDGPRVEYNQLSGWLNVVETSSILFGTIVGDWVLIHRCWILWGRMWRWIFVSSILWIGCLFCTIRIIILEASFSGEGVFNSKKIIPYGASFWAASILINISTTVLTVLRIWLFEEANKRSGLQPPESDEFPRSTLHYIICITVESGLLYTLTAIATFITYVTQSTAVYIMVALELPIVGIACNLIILRANRRQKRLLKQRTKETLELSRFRVADTVPYTMGTIEPKSMPTMGMNSPTTTSGRSRATGTIEEIPYP